MTTPAKHKPTISNAQFFASLPFVLAGIYGYGMNIYKLATAAGLGGMEVVRAVGLFLPPVGVLMGFV